MENTQMQYAVYVVYFYVLWTMIPLIVEWILEVRARRKGSKIANSTKSLPEESKATEPDPLAQKPPIAAA